MPHELLESTDSAVTYTPTFRPASATVVLKDCDGNTKGSPSVTLDSVGTAGTATITTVTSQTQVAVDSATGITAGMRLWLAPVTGQGSVVIVSTVTGTTLTLEGSPAATLATGDKLHGVTLRATVPAASLSPRGLHWRLEWTVTAHGTGSVTTEQEPCHVVRTRFRDPLTSGEASRYIGYAHPNTIGTAGRDAGWVAELADRASNKVRRLIMGKGVYQHLLSPDADAFRDAGLAALRVELAHQGLIPRGYPAEGYTEETEKSCRRLVYETIDALMAYDRDDDGAVDPGEVQRPAARAVRLRR